MKGMHTQQDIPELMTYFCAFLKTCLACVVAWKIRPHTHHERVLCVKTKIIIITFLKYEK